MWPISGSMALRRRRSLASVGVSPLRVPLISTRVVSTPFAANLVGDGIKPSSLIEDAALRDRVQRLWLAWTDEADADGLTDFYGLQAMVAREMFVAGECFVRLRTRRAEDRLTVPLQLQLLQSEMLPFEKTETAANGNRIRCGIEFDAIGRRVAYYFRRRHPGDSTDPGQVVPESVRVPAEDVLHVYRPIDAGQIRGLPHVAPAMVRLFLLDQYDDAELDRAVAKHIGILTERETFIHAYERMGVVEQALTKAWRRRIAFVFRFPNPRGRA